VIVEFKITINLFITTYMHDCNIHLMIFNIIIEFMIKDLMPYLLCNCLQSKDAQECRPYLISFQDQ